MNAKTLSAKTMARHNRDLILDLMRRRRALSRHEIREYIGTSPATINRLTTNLLDRGLLRDAGLAPSTGGRRSMQLRFNERAGVIIAIDVGSRILRAGVIDLCGGVIHFEEHQTPDTGPRTRLEQVQKTAANLSERFASTERCLAVAAGVPGIVDHEGKVSWAPALGWHEVPLARALEEATDLPVVVENDANTLAIAEHRYGEARGESVLLAINLGNGIGAGIISNEVLYRGHTRSAGEVGYMLTSTGALAHTYEGFGDLESRIGSEAITARARAAGLRSIEGSDLAAAEVFECARGGDPAALKLIDEIVDELALALANLAAMLDPAVIVLGGGIAASADLIIPRVSERLRGRIPQTPRLLPPSLGQSGVLIGAAELALDHVGSLDAALTDHSE